MRRRRKQSTKYEVQGMTSGSCIGSAQDAISKLDGLDGADVTLQPGAATVEANPANATAP
ncbi:MAG: heavy metal-associated domain-containing protein [Caldimonas sp.]